MAGGKTGRNVANDFDRSTVNGAMTDDTANNDGVANDIDDSDDVFGTEAGKFHDGPSKIAARPSCAGDTNAAANSSDA
jgi:hypothetical protein